MDPHRLLLSSSAHGPSSSFHGRLTIDGPYFAATGRVVYPLGLTGFLLRKRFLEGNDTDALKWLDLAAGLATAAGDGVVPLVREFSEVDWTGPPGKGVEQGFFARDYPDYEADSHWMYEEAQARGVYIQTVALTYRHPSVQQAIDHCAMVDRIAAQHENAVFQAANEPSVNGIEIDAIVAGFTPTCRPADTGRLAPSPHPGWDYVGDHPDRDSEFCRKFKGGWEVQTGEGPINAFQPPWRGGFYQDEPDRLENQPSADDWASFFAGNRLFCAGGVIHGGQWAQGCHVEMMTADIKAKLDAICRAVRMVPAQRYHRYYHPPDNGSLRRYQRDGDDGRRYEISVRPFQFFAV